MSILSPLDSEVRDQVPLLVPGVVAGIGINMDLAEHLVDDGYQTIVIGHKGGGPRAGREVEAVWRGILEGDLDEHIINGTVVPDGHSLGAGRVVRAAAYLRMAGASPDQLGCVLHAPACFDGVTPRSVLSSLVEELSYIADRRSPVHAIEAGVGAIRYAWGTGPVLLGRELRYASVHKEIDRAAWLIEDGVKIAAVLHDDDGVINPIASEAGLRTAGVQDIFHVNMDEDEYEDAKALHSAQYSEAGAVKEALVKALAAVRPDAKLRQAS